MAIDMIPLIEFTRIISIIFPFDKKLGAIRLMITIRAASANRMTRCGLTARQILSFREILTVFFFSFIPSILFPPSLNGLPGGISHDRLF